MSAVALALGTSTCYGVASFVAPMLARRYSIAIVLLVGQGAALLAAVAVLVAVGDPLPAGGPLAFGILAGAGNAVGLIAFLRAVEHGPISLAAPIGATSVVLPVAYDVLTGHALSPWEAAGLLCAVAGIALASRRPAGDGEEQTHDLRRCVLLSLVSAAGIGVLLMAMPHAAAGGRWWALVDARAVIVVAVLAFAARSPSPIRRRSLPPVRALPSLAAPGLMLLSGTLLYTLAAERGSLAIVSVLASMSPAITVALAFAILGERLAAGQRRGIAVVLLGVCILAASK